MKNYAMKGLFKSVCSTIAKKEGKKHQASIGDIREILTIFADIYMAQPILMTLMLIEIGAKRAMKK